MFLIWWLSPVELQFLDDNVLWLLHDYIASEVRSLRGSAGPGRLWVARELGAVRVAPDADWSTPLGMFLMRTCGGIVIRTEDAPLLARMPGIITTLDLARWIGGA